MVRVRPYFCWAVAVVAFFAVIQGRAEAQKSDAKAKVTATASKPGPDGKQVVLITVEIDKGWQAYANPVGLDDLVPSQTKVFIASKNRPEDAQIEYPVGKEIQDRFLGGNYYVYEGRVTIKATLKRAPGNTEPLTVKVRFQAWNPGGGCLLPATVELKDVKPQ